MPTPNTPSNCPIVSEHDTYRSLQEQISNNPPNWKDWVSFVGMIITVSVVVAQGGRMIERLDNAGDSLKSVVTIVGKLNDDLGSVRIELAKAQGADALHDEKIKALDGRVSSVEYAERRSEPRSEPRHSQGNQSGPAR